jgi:hypothetical protein
MLNEQVMEDDGGLFNIEISFSDEAVAPQKPSRDHQSEENFRQQRASWKPKIENGKVVFLHFLYEFPLLTSFPDLEVTKASHK